MGAGPALDGRRPCAGWAQALRWMGAGPALDGRRPCAGWAQALRPYLLLSASPN